MKLINSALILLMMIWMMGCDSLIGSLNEEPPHITTSDNLYTTYNGFDAGINGVYATIREEHRGGEPSQQMAMNGTDNMVTNFLISGGFGQIASEWGSFNNPSHSLYSNTFAWLYEIVNATNAIVNRADAEDIDWNGGNGNAEENKNYILAEARAVRAWAYRHLSYLWGDVPLSLEESSGSTIKTDWVRTPVDEVREQIISDLLFAEQYLPIEPMAGRMSKGAVQHYLAEMYLATDDPENALYWSDQAINTPEYQLVTERYGVRADDEGVPFMDMFHRGNKNREEGNTEALWVWQFGYQVIGGGSDPRTRAEQQGRFMDMVIDGVQPLQMTVERGGRGKGRTAPTKWLMESYESQDDRFSNYVLRQFFILKDADGNAPQDADILPPGMAYGDTIRLRWEDPITADNHELVDWPYTRKVEGSVPGDVTSNENYDDYIAVRLGDTYLLKAEAEYKLGRSGDAAETINVIRRRSNASDVDASVIDLDFILDERSRELFGEEYRRYTLLRTNRWIDRTRVHNTFGGERISEKDILFPIPQSVIDANLTQEMPQNPGY